MRAGQSTEKAALIHQHSTDAQQQRVAEQLDRKARADREQAANKKDSTPGTRTRVTGNRPKGQPPGTDPARGAWNGRDNQQDPGL